MLVYYHNTWKWRSENKVTRVGAAPPDGLTGTTQTDTHFGHTDLSRERVKLSSCKTIIYCAGFNSGVMLMRLDRMRTTELYKSVIDGPYLGQVKCHFQSSSFTHCQSLFFIFETQWWYWLIFSFSFSWLRNTHSRDIWAIRIYTL